MQRTHVTKNGVANLRARLTEFAHRELPDVLVSHDQIEAVFSSFGKNGTKRVSRKILELIHIKIKVFTLIFRNIHATHGRHLKLSNQHKSQKLGVERSQFSFRKIDQKDFLTVHDFTNIEGRFGLANGIAHDAVRDERTELRGEIRDHFLAFTVSGIGVFMIPKGFYDGVLYF
ncbi:MAG: hypothetical protein ACD_28C00117G0002 [uncultured bacterium]|nr:MAG: hypothetical protein ACD_28C00117G0002 [uncultured bacterium]